MTSAQRKAHKIGNQLRKYSLLNCYYKVKPAEKGWIPLGGVCQDGKYTHMAKQYRHEMMSMFGHASDCDCSRCEPMVKLYNSLPHVIAKKGNL